MEWAWLLLIVALIGWRLYLAVLKLLRRLAPRAKRYIPKKVKAYVFMRDGGVCRHCGATGRKDSPLEYDHIKPFSWGGQSVAANLQLLCVRCNGFKSNRYAG